MIDLVQSIYRELEVGGWILLLIFTVGTAGWFRAAWWFLQEPHISESDRIRVDRWLQNQDAETLLDHRTIEERLPAPGFLKQFTIRAIQIETTPLQEDEGLLNREVRAIGTAARARIKFVKICAAVLPLLGLFGTILGIVKSFDALAVYGTGQIQLLSNGISQALLTTQAGLLLAIPLLFVYRYMNSKTNEFIENLTLISNQIQASVPPCR